MLDILNTRVSAALLSPIHVSLMLPIAYEHKSTVGYIFCVASWSAAIRQPASMFLLLPCHYKRRTSEQNFSEHASENAPEKFDWLDTSRYNVSRFSFSPLLVGSRPGWWHNCEEIIDACSQTPKN